MRQSFSVLILFRIQSEIFEDLYLCKALVRASAFFVRVVLPIFVPETFTLIADFRKYRMSSYTTENFALKELHAIASTKWTRIALHFFVLTSSKCWTKSEDFLTEDTSSFTDG